MQAYTKQLLHKDEVDMIIYGVVKSISTKAEGRGGYWFDHSSTDSSVQ
jgi:hypothetical protein